MVEVLDLSRFEAGYRLGAQGRAPYHPAMLVALVLYAWSRGVHSSRRIERACHDDVGARVVCAGYFPDHTTIARFVKDHQAALKELFTQVLALCREAGLVTLGLVAVDGTRMRANAALGANRTATSLDEEIEAFLSSWVATDQAEDAAEAERGGGRAPEPVDRAGRLERLRAARARLEAEARAGRGEAKANVTDPDSRIMVGPTGGYLQAFNAQVVVGEGQIVLAAEATNDENDAHLLVPMVDQAMANLAAIGVDGRPEVVVADAGYFCTEALAGAGPEGPEFLVATTKRGRPVASSSPSLEELAAQAAAEEAVIEAEVAAERSRRAGVYERIAAGELSLHSAAGLLGLSLEPTWRGYHRWREGGLEAVPVRRRGRRLKPPSPASKLRSAMEAKLVKPEYQALYRRRAHLAEGTFAAIKHQRGARMFLRRGLEGVDTEWKLHATVHNLARLRRALTAVLSALGGQDVAQAQTAA